MEGNTNITIENQYQTNMDDLENEKADDITDNLQDDGTTLDSYSDYAGCDEASGYDEERCAVKKERSLSESGKYEDSPPIYHPREHPFSIQNILGLEDECGKFL